MLLVGGTNRLLQRDLAPATGATTYTNMDQDYQPDVYAKSGGFKCAIPGQSVAEISGGSSNATAAAAADIALQLMVDGRSEERMIETEGVFGAPPIDGVVYARFLRDSAYNYNQYPVPGVNDINMIYNGLDGRKSSTRRYLSY